MKIKISVIIPFYSNFKLLKRAIYSVQSQSFKNYELIIIYDNPEDKENIKLLKEFVKKRKIEVLINKKNLGAGLSRNKGIRKAKGEFIAFLDSDDIWKKNKLRIQYDYMKKNNSLISHTSYDLFDENNKFLQKRLARKLNYFDLLKSCDIGLSTVMVKKKLLFKHKLFPSLKTKEDYVLWLKISKSGILFYGIEKVLTNWTDRKNSLSKSSLQKIKDAFNVYYKYEKFDFLDSLFKVIILSINFLRKK
tara:strand:+ start:1092 stop:1835 length:744 start_codon:yes stop_codon:yes gene_type:complete